MCPATPTALPVTTGTDWSSVDETGFRTLMRTLAEPVVVITGRLGDARPGGMTVSSFSAVSLVPPLVLFCAGRSSATWAGIAPSGRFAVNVLGEQDAALAWQFASPGDRFARVAHILAPDGSPVLPEALSTLLCTVAAVHPAGDHDIVVGHVRAARSGRPRPPLAYHAGRFTRLHVGGADDSRSTG